MPTMPGSLPVILATVAMLLAAAPAHAVGEAVNGFPSWGERVVHEWMNRARSDPQAEMTACGSNCGDAPCYAPMPPLGWRDALNRSSRFHSDEMLRQGYFAHDSACGVVANIAALYPGSCDGSASCACVGGTKTCPCTSWSSRITLFGVSASAEIIASGTDPNVAFYQWLFETFPGPMIPPSCAFVQGPPTNGHRWNILQSTGSVGIGMSGPTVADFSGAPVPAAKIASGAHYPRQAASVDAWANWYDAAGPLQARVNVDGTCLPMTLARGSVVNGAYTATVTGVGSGCHRYRFEFEDAAGGLVTYPTTGSLAIGSGAGCPDWDPSEPVPCSGATTTTTSPTPTTSTTTTTLPDDGGFVPPDKDTAACENAVAKSYARLAGAIVKCHVKAATAAFKQTPFDEEGCEAAAKAKYDATHAKILAKVPCPDCLRANLGLLGAELETWLDGRNAQLYCAGTVPLP
jgi:hypothetical protein